MAIYTLNIGIIHHNLLLLDCQLYQLYQEIHELIDKLPDHISQQFFTLMIK